MRVKDITVTAVIPNAQYSNLQPSITVELEEGDDVEQAKAVALSHIEAISKDYAEAGKALPQLHPVHNVQGQAAQPSGVHQELIRLESEITPGWVNFDEENHIYTDEWGHVYLSGSTFAHKFSPEFNADFIVPKMEAKYGVSGSDIKAMWDCKKEASTSFGTGLHKALELFGKYQELGMTIDKIKIAEGKVPGLPYLHNQPILQKAVTEFFADRMDELAIYEPFIVDMNRRICGSIDRLLIIDPIAKRCRIQDYKTSCDILDVGSPKKLSAPFAHLENNKLNEYYLQCAFYQSILEAAGWTVEGYDIFNYTDQWETHSRDAFDITVAIAMQNKPF